MRFAAVKKIKDRLTYFGKVAIKTKLECFMAHGVYYESSYLDRLSV